MSSTQSKVSSPLTCNSTYSQQFYQITTPWQYPLIIINILESLKLILESVVAKNGDATEYTEEDAEEEVEVDVAK